LGRLTALSLVLFACGPIPIFASDASFLVLSDIHFNPLADESLRERLAAADFQSWESILSQSPGKNVSKSGEDTNWPLLESVLHRAATVPGKPKFVLLTGDLFAHHLREKLEHDGSPPLDFASFAQKTALFLEREFKTALPEVPVIMALGNNDGDCSDVDYSIEPGGLFLRKTLPAIANAAGVLPASLEDSWLSLGSYDTPHPTLKNSRIVVLNTTFLSWRYRNSCGEKGDDPGTRLLEWLRTRLSSARAQNQKVWLVYHIPPGVDSFASTHQRAPNAEKIVTMWNPRYQAEFEKVLDEYRSTVQNQLAGHTHFDDFRLLGTPGAYSSFVLINPGVSPNVHQNPAVREIMFRSDGVLTDLKTWYLPLLDGGKEWKLGYQFRREWKLKVIDLPNLSNLYSQIHESPKVRAEWEDVYSVWSLDKKGMTKRDFTAIFCATGNARPEDFRKCFCDASSEAAFCRQ
jgi:hypothetical protein